MEFNPNSNIVKLCLQGMDLEEKSRPEEACSIFLQAWNEGTNDFEKFLAAYYVSRHQKNVPVKLKWIETALQFASNINDDNIKSAFPALYSNIANCFEELGDLDKAKENHELATSFKGQLYDNGPFYHGTKVDLKVAIC